MIQWVPHIFGLHMKDQTVKMNDNPSDQNKILDKDPNGEPKKKHWNYHSTVGCLSCNQSMIRNDITMLVQKMDIFCNNTSQEHEKSVKKTFCNVLKTKERGLVKKTINSRIWNATYMLTRKDTINIVPPMTPICVYIEQDMRFNTLDAQ